MNPSFGPNAFFFERPCQRKRLFSPFYRALGIPKNTELWKRGRPSKVKAKNCPAQTAKEVQERPPHIYQRPTQQGVRRAIDIYMPRFEPDVEPESVRRQRRRYKALFKSTAALLKKLGAQSNKNDCAPGQRRSIDDVNFANRLLRRGLRHLAANAARRSN